MFPRVPNPSGSDEGASSLTSASQLEDSINLTSDVDWWADAIEEDTFNSPLPFDGSEGGLFNGRFVPPPPRPPFLEESISSDGLTTCDLCSWAWRDRNAFSLDGSLEAAGELSWALTLVIVSLISALIGAIVMVIVLRCRRLKSANTNGRPLPWWCRRSSRQGAVTARSNLSTKHQADSIRGPHATNSGVWTWLGTRRASAGPDQLTHSQSSPAENHYTHMDDAYSPVGVGEALYAELDRDSVQSGNPSYQNTAYSQCGEADQDMPIVSSSAPSSAYYSDLSVTAMPTTERAYEVVGLTMMHQNWDPLLESGHTSLTQTTQLNGNMVQVPVSQQIMGRRPNRLAAINESSSSGAVPSDYV